LKSLKYFDLAVKIEVTMYEFQSLLTSVSMIEISAFIFGVVFFLKLMAKMKNVWFFIPHLIRGVCGLILNDKMPKSHEIVKQLEIDKLSESSTITFEEIHQGIKNNIEKAYFEFVEKTMNWVKAYGILTVVSGLFDFFNLVIILHHFGEKGSEYEEMTLLGLCMVFWSCNLYWAGSVFLLYYKFPNYIGKYLQETFFGVGVLLDKKLKKISANARIN